MLTLIVLLTLLFGVEEDIFIFRGDVNGDSFIDISDPIALNNHLFAGAPLETCPAAWDANSDGTVNSTDPIFLLNYLFAGGSAPFPETVTCGETP